MTTTAKSIRYRIEPTMSIVAVHVFSGGLLSFIGHNPRLEASAVRGHVLFGADGDRRGQFDVTVRSDSLHVAGDVRPADRQEIERRTREEVLETAKYSEIRFEGSEVGAEQIGDNKVRLRVEGQLSLHGHMRRLGIDLTIRAFSSGIRVRGEFPLKQSDFGIAPVTAAGGTIRLKDEARVLIDIGAKPVEDE